MQNEIEMKTIESLSSAYKRITNGLRKFINHGVEAAKLIHEAKRLEIWKQKWSSWQEYCEKEFGKSRQRAWELLEVANTISEIQSVRQPDTESGKNKEILANLNARQAAALKGLPPEQKAEVFEKAINKAGGKAPTPSVIVTARKSVTDPPRRRSVFDPDPTPRDNSRAYESPCIEDEKPEPKDRSTPADAQVFDEFSKKYPKVFSFLVENEAEEKRLNECVESIMAYRPQNGAKPATTATLIAALCSAYKSVKKKTLGVSKADSREMRTLFESYGAAEIPAIVEVFKKAIVTDKFHCRNAHQLHSFGKNYSNVRNEIENENNATSGRSGVDRNAGTANAKTIGQYDGVGKVV